MPRTRSHTPTDLSQAALKVFWQSGYHATSMDDLVRATGVSKHGIYTDYGGKRDLFLTCFAQYQTLVVTPAFHIVEEPGADLGSIARYFETQIALAEKTGLPGPGCFVANAATEVAPHDADVRAQVAAHNARLLAGFRNALMNTAVDLQVRAPDEVAGVATTLLIFSIGLWSASRNVADADVLRDAVRTVLQMIESRHQ